MEEDTGGMYTDEDVIGKLRDFVFDIDYLSVMFVENLFDCCIIIR